MKAINLDINLIQEYQRNSFPYLFMDFAKVIPGKSAEGYRDLTEKDFFFKVHFPGDPNMPGMLQIEALLQLAALTVLTLPGNKGKVMYLTSAKNIKLSRKILQGERLDMETELISFRRGIAKCSGKGSVKGQLACKAEFTLVLPDTLKEYKVTKNNKSDLK